ncbi:MAG: IS256 family transposase [Planctomycetes bacterium]|nr:IS256 family transposase [Planctomycetota bacterium]
MLFEKKALKELLKNRKVKDLADFNSLMSELSGEVVEILLEGELTDYLGYEKYDHKAKTIDNRRNGSSSKEVKSKFGKIGLNIPRDRESKYSPQLVKKHERDVSGLDEKVISLYAKGLTSRDICSHVDEIYDYQLSAESVSHITNKVLESAQEWQSRPLENIYAIIFLDALFVKMRLDGAVRKVAVYNILGITLSGHKDYLGLWIGESESASYWASVLSELKNRGLKDVLIFSVDNLSGISEAIEATYPKAEIQKCVVHQIRNSFKYVARKDSKELVKSLKRIYQASTQEQAELALVELKYDWGERYPHVVKSWESNWPELSPFLKYPPEIRRLMYTTNSIENLHRQLRKVSKARTIFPNKEAVLKLFYLAIKDMNKKQHATRRAIRDWSIIYPQLVVHFQDRLKPYLNI